MMLWCVVVCLLLGVIASAPLSSDSDPWSASSSDEDPQLPAVFPVAGGAPQQTPPSLIMEVKDTEKNLTLSFAIFIIPEEEEGSTMDREGRSDDSSRSDDVSSEEYSSQDIQPILVLRPYETASSHPIKREHDDSLIVSVMESTSSEEMMNDQPVLTFPGEEFDDFNNTVRNRKYWNQRKTVSEDSDSFDKNTETNTPPAGITDDNSTTSDKSLSFPSEVTEQHPNGQGVTLNPGDEPADSGKSGTFGANRVSSSSGSISKDFEFGLNFSEAFDSIQEVMDLLSGNQGGFRGTASHHKGHGVTPDSVTGHQVGVGVNSEESDESLETASFSRVVSDSKHQSSVSPDLDSKESPKAIINFQSSSDPSTTLTYDLTSPGSDSREVQDTYKGSSLNPVSPKQDVSPVVLKMPKQSMSRIHNQDITRFLPQMGVSLTSDSSEESPLGLTSPGPGLFRVGSLEDSSSSEEVLLAVFSSVSSPQSPTESESSESEDQTSSSDSGSELETPEHGPGNNSQSTELLPDPELKFSPGSETNFSSTFIISKEESEESQIPKTPKDANATGGSDSSRIASSSEVSMGREDAEVDLSSVHDVSTDKDPTSAYTTSPPSETVSSGASCDAITDASRDLSAEEDDASKETDTTDFAVNMKPTAPTGYITHPTYSRASTDANANIEKERMGSKIYSEANTEANSLGRNQLASSDENITAPPRPPPRRKKPYRFGSLGPINYSRNNQPVARETESEEKFASLITNTRGRFKALQQQQRNKQHIHSGPLHTFFKGQYNSGRKRHPQTADRQPIRKLTRISLAKVANVDQSSSEETK